MPFVSGFLRLRRRGRPGQPLPPGEEPVDPDYGIEEGELPEVEPPDPPPGIWPPLTPDHPWRPVDPGYGLDLPLRPGQRPPSPDQPGHPEHPIVLPPGMIWPPLPEGVHGKFLALVLIAGTPGYKYRYVVIDADALPPRPDGTPEHPIAPGTPPREPKRG